MLNKDEYIQKKKDEYYKRKNEEYVKQKIKQSYKKKQIDKYYTKKNSVNYYSENRKNNILVQLTDNLSKRIYGQLQKLNIKKTFRYNDLLGCTLNEFGEYIESKFIDNMSFDNYPEWEIDHMIPVSAFDFNNEDEIIKCCHYTNLQPLWKHDNRKKSNKMP